MRLIPTRIHGVLDYATAGLFIVLPNTMGATTIGKRIMYGMAAGTTAASLMTRYELGVWRILPMKAHLVVDALTGASLIGAAMMHKGSSRAVMIGLGLMEIGAALFTERVSPVEVGHETRDTSAIAGISQAYQQLVSSQV